MSTESIFQDYVANVEPESVTAKEFYRTIFAEGELQKQGVQEDGKYNALIQIGKGKFIYLHDELDNLPDYEQVYSAKMNYISYAGQTGEDTLARELHAFAIRVNFPERMTWHALKDLFDRHQRKRLPKILPTFVVCEGENLIFVYALTEPIPMFDKFIKKLKALNTTLAREIHSAIEASCFSACKKPRQGGLYARYAVVDTIVDGDLCNAFRTGDLYTLNDINALVPKAQQLHYYKGKVTVAEAQALWPAWYDYRVKRHRTIKSNQPWALKEGAYSWFLDIALSNPDTVMPGVLRALTAYAVKADIDRETLLDDMVVLSAILEPRFPKEEIQMHYNTALRLLDEEPGKLNRWPLRYIEKLSGLTLPRNKRNYRTQKQHLAKVHKAQSKERAVRQWQKKHPDGTRADCAHELGITWNTVNRWWVKELPAEQATVANTKSKVFDCGCPSPDIVKSTQRWYWDERGNFYKRVIYTCKNCGCVHIGKARIDNTQG